jgi:hypothetical protein
MEKVLGLKAFCDFAGQNTLDTGLSNNEVADEVYPGRLR